VEKRGLVDRLKAEKVTRNAKICWADEMRLGLISQVRRVWCSIGTKIVQKIQISYQYIYLHLAVDGMNGTLHWDWAKNMKTEAVVKMIGMWQADNIDAIIWDGASSHRSNEIKQLDTTLICQPPYAPELNPAERVFEAIRQAVEGIIYPSLEEKQKVVDAFLNDLVEKPEKIQSLAGWEWIRKAIVKLPISDT
jgi:transposase